MGIKEDINSTQCNHCNSQLNNNKEVKKGKMKVLKKIKKRFGLASRSLSSGGGTNNLPPLLFHNVHGENVVICNDGIVAKRVDSFCKGIVFSSRPIKINEKVCIKFLEISNNWSGVIRFGFTYNDPTSLRNGLPKYACPDLTNKPGYWAKALPERYCSPNTMLHYYVNSAGDVHFGINGEEKGIFFSGVECRGPLWALIDVYGNSTAIEFIDIRHQLNNSRCNIENNVDRIIQPMQHLQITQQQQQQHNRNDVEEMSLPLLRYQPSQLMFNAMHLHRTRGQNVRFANTNRSIAYRTDTEFCQGYVFTSRPLHLNERVVVQILNTEPMYHGCLGLGLTSCDPSTLQSHDLPADANFLLDRPEYWVISKDFARNLNKGDEISFCISYNGEVQISRNGGVPLVVMHVDQTLRLWAFFDIYGSTQKIRVLSCQQQRQQQQQVIEPSPTQRRILSPASSASESMNSLNSQSEQLRRNSVLQQQQQRVCCVTTPTSAGIRVEPTTNGGAVLSVIINQKPCTQPQNPHASHTPVSPNSIIAPIPTTSNLTGTMMSNTYMEPISTSSSYSTPVSCWPSSDLPSSVVGGGNLPIAANAATTGTNGVPLTGTECTICYEKTIDAVLYMCGHMCMCYECALQQWRGKGGGQCPLCRAVIKDVIRTYKS